MNGDWRVQSSTFCTPEVSVFEAEAFLLDVAEDASDETRIALKGK
jgi:hypothetical protein